MNTDSGAGFDIEPNETIYKSRDELLSNNGDLAEFAHTYPSDLKNNPMEKFTQAWFAAGSTRPHKLTSPSDKKRIFDADKANMFLSANNPVTLSSDINRDLPVL